jgi:hypothetical protein
MGVRSTEALASHRHATGHANARRSCWQVAAWTHPRDDLILAQSARMLAAVSKTGGTPICPERIKQHTTTSCSSSRRP